MDIVAQNSALAQGYKVQVNKPSRLALLHDRQPFITKDIKPKLVNLVMQPDCILSDHSSDWDLDWQKTTARPHYRVDILVEQPWYTSPTINHIEVLIKRRLSLSPNVIRQANKIST